MHSRFATVFIRLVILIILVIGGCSAFFYQSWELFALFFSFVFLSVLEFVRFSNEVHRKVTFFFEAVKYEDGSLHFNEDQKDGQVKELHKNLNRINNLISNIRVREAQSERFFKEFMKHSASGLMAVNDQNFVEIANDSALKIIGLSNITHLTRLEQTQPELFALMMSLSPGQSEQLRVLEGNNLKQMAVKVAVIQLAQKEYRIFSIYDIKSEIEANELDTWQKLMQIMTHEIMNSIAPISSLSQTISSFFTKEGKPVSLNNLKQDDIDNTIKGLSVIEERAIGLRGFVANYRKLTKVPEPEFSNIEIDSWLASIQLLYKAQSVANGILFKTQNTYSKPTFSGDERLLTHVVLNLLNNATQALENRVNKTITIVVETNELGNIQVKITDNGKGFSPEERDKIFLPFYTSHENGSGIGLSLSRQIMRKHKGSISAFSEPGVETCFVLAF